MKIFPKESIHSSKRDHEAAELEQVLDTITNYDHEDIAAAQAMLRQLIEKYKGPLK